MRKLAQHICDLALRAAFVNVVIPSANVGKRNLHSQVRLDELRQLLQAVAEPAARILRARSGLVLGGIGGLQHFHRIESFLPRAVKDRVDGLLVHGFKSIRDRGRVCIPSPDSEVVDVVYRHRSLRPGQDARQSWSQRNRAKGRFLGGHGQRTQRAV